MAHYKVRNPVPKIKDNTFWVFSLSILSTVINCGPNKILLRKHLRHCSIPVHTQCTPERQVSTHTHTRETDLLD